MIKEIETDIISEDIKAKMAEHAIKAYPSECCGILFGKYIDNGVLKVFDIKEAENLSDDPYIKKDTDPYRNYEMSPLQIYKAEKELSKKGLEIVGFYHSHPNKAAVLSEKDKAGMMPGLYYTVLSVTKYGCREVRVWKKVYS